MSLLLPLLGTALCFIIGGWLIGMLIGDRIASRLSTPTRPFDPIVGPQTPVVTYDTGGPFIAMPERLRTREEMVAWLTNDLPKLTADRSESRT
jgi:hypothetical protein